MTHHWDYPHTINIDEWAGFIYVITELDTGKKYIGKKFFKHKKTMPPLKGRKNNRIRFKESDWKEYSGSSKELNHCIKTKGLVNYHFKILSLHETKGSLSYREVELQVQTDCLRSAMYFNKQIAPVKYIPPYQTDKEKQYKTNT